jgi:SAM-dependent methyltransferase
MTSPTWLESGYATAEGRTLKAKKIETVVQDYLKLTQVKGLKILDIGSGSGHIAAYFATKNQVTTLDSVDQITVPDRSLFELVVSSAPLLPFPSSSFDLIISNHVMAYLPDQLQHFEELARLLKPTGIAYLATPNRFFPLEPHTRAPFLHWLPQAIYQRSIRYLTGHDQKVEVPTVLKLESLAKKVGLQTHDYTIKIIKDPSRYAMTGERRKFIPYWVRYLSPTTIQILTR